MSSTKARPVIGSVSGSIPALIRYCLVPVASPVVKSHFSGPGTGRGGGSASVAPHHTCTAWMRPSDIWTGSVRITRSVFGVMLARPMLPAPSPDNIDAPPVKTSLVAPRTPISCVPFCRRSIPVR